MSTENYLSQLKKNEKLLFMQDRAPQLIAVDQSCNSVSEEVFSRKEIYNFMSYVGLNSSELKKVNYFHLNGKKYQVNALVLSDLIQLEISLADTELFTFSDLILPGYVFDWAQSSKGLVVFYGPDMDAVKKFNLSFAKFRADQLAGSSLVFNDSGSSFVGREDHRVVFSESQKEYLETGRSPKLFDAISFSDEIEKNQVNKLMANIDQQTLVSLPVCWSDISSAWGALTESFGSSKEIKFLLNNLIGFVGVKTIETQVGQKEYFFETVPFTNVDQAGFSDISFESQVTEIEKMKETKGYSFNQSIQALLLKRRIILESAYEASPDPKELNSMLTQVGF